MNVRLGAVRFILASNQVKWEDKLPSRRSSRVSSRVKVEPCAEASCAPRFGGRQRSRYPVIGGPGSPFLVCCGGTEYNAPTPCVPRVAWLYSHAPGIDWALDPAMKTSRPSAIVHTCTLRTQAPVGMYVHTMPIQAGDFCVREDNCPLNLYSVIRIQG